MSVDKCMSYTTELVTADYLPQCVKANINSSFVKKAIACRRPKDKASDTN